MLFPGTLTAENTCISGDVVDAVVFASFGSPYSVANNAIEVDDTVFCPDSGVGATPDSGLGRLVQEAESSDCLGLGGGAGDCIFECRPVADYETCGEIP